ncbi:siderophore-interacting protein [Zhihengliuella alba]|uniref:Siderophore-interacting protein n=1 Tax=Zhihengliuella alba TaxID=547018 RepID=A0ABP7D726_9MICC
MSDARPARGPKPQVVLEVLRSERIGGHMVRLTLGGEGFAAFQDKEATDKYVKLLFADPELGLTPPYNLEELAKALPPERMPVRRTYTVHDVDHDAQTLQIDFVVHGDQGLAGPWAERAQPGDVVCFAGPGGMYLPDPAADWHLIGGDESALPAISATLAALPADARGLVWVEVVDAADEVPLQAPEGVEVRWVHRGGPFAPESTRLAAAIQDGPWLDGDVQVFVHGEREMIKAVRRYLTDVRGVPRTRMSLSPYWAYGRVEDVFQAEKREPIGQIFPENQPLPGN